MVAVELRRPQIGQRRSSGFAERDPDPVVYFEAGKETRQEKRSIRMKVDKQALRDVCSVVMCMAAGLNLFLDYKSGERSRR